MIYLDYSQFIHETYNNNDRVTITDLKRYCATNNINYKDMIAWMKTAGRYTYFDTDKSYKYSGLYERSFIGIKLVDNQRK